MKKVYNFLLISIFLLSCTPTPQEIEYHYDECAYCAMKISDSKFGAELVTDKSKVYKFDSGECLIDYVLKENPELGLLLVTDYTRPHTLIDAYEAIYLISQNLPSPMGANLSSYESLADAEKMQSEKGGELYTYDQVLELFKNRR